MYKVVKKFTDLQDYKHLYNVGDLYPREGLKVSGKRIKELMSSTNRQGVALIEEIKEEPKVEETIEEPKEIVEEQVEEKVEEIVEKPKKRTKKK